MFLSLHEYWRVHSTRETRHRKTPAHQHRVGPSCDSTPSYIMRCMLPLHVLYSHPARVTARKALLPHITAADRRPPTAAHP